MKSTTVTVGLTVTGLETALTLCRLLVATSPLPAPWEIKKKNHQANLLCLIKNWIHFITFSISSSAPECFKAKKKNHTRKSLLLKINFRRWSLCQIQRKFLRCCIYSSGWLSFYFSLALTSFCFTWTLIYLGRFSLTFLAIYLSIPEDLTVGMIDRFMSLNLVFVFFSPVGQLSTWSLWIPTLQTSKDGESTCVTMKAAKKFTQRVHTSKPTGGYTQVELNNIFFTAVVNFC